MTGIHRRHTKSMVSRWWKNDKSMI